MRRKAPFSVSLTIAFALALPLIAPGGAYAQEEGENIPEAEREVVGVPFYELGDQNLMIGLGSTTLLFVHNPYADPGERAQRLDRTRIGGLGFLRWNAFVGENISVGAELSGSFMSSPNRHRTLFQVPITARLGYTFVRYPFEFPVHMGLGINFMTLEERFYFGPTAQAGGGVLYNATADWAFGLETRYSWVPENYTGGRDDGPEDTDTRFGNFLQINLVARYNF